MVWRAALVAFAIAFGQIADEASYLWLPNCSHCPDSLAAKVLVNIAAAKSL